MKPRSFPSSCDRSCVKMAALYIKNKHGDRICGAITRLSQNILICQFLANQATCKRTRHCWPTTPNIVGCYMLRPFAHPFPCRCVLLGVVAQILKLVKLLATNGRKNSQQCWELLANNVASVCTRLWLISSFPA